MEEYVNENTIVKDNIYEVFKDSITCIICKSIMIEPVICLGCQNIFCKKCKENLKNNGENCPEKCPNPIINDVIGQNNFITKFKFNCIKGCGEEIPFNEIKNHYSSDCLSQKKKIKALSKEEVAKYREKVNKDIDKIKSNLIIFIYNYFFIFIVITLGYGGVGKTSLINT